MVVAVGAASATAFMTAGYLNGARQGITRDVVANLDGVQVTVVENGANANLDTGMSPELLAVLDTVPGAEPVARRGAGVLTGAVAGELVFVSAFQDPWFVDEPVRGTIDESAFERGEALINTALARDAGLRPGDTVRLLAPTGVVELPVQAVVAGGGASDRGVQIPYDLYTQHYHVPPPRSVVVAPAPGTSLPDLEEAIRAAVRDASAAGSLPDTEVRILSPTALAAESSDSVARQLAPFWTLQRGLLAVSFVAVLSTLVLVGIQRRRELAMLGAVGMEPAVLARMVLAEAGLVGLCGIALTATAGFVMLWALNRVAPLLIGYTTPLAPDWWALVVWGAVSLVVALLAALWPARRAARIDVVTNLQFE
jgi:putative ABC transport system permease protein